MVVKTVVVFSFFLLRENNGEFYFYSHSDIYLLVDLFGALSCVMITDRAAGNVCAIVRDHPRGFLPVTPNRKKKIGISHHQDGRFLIYSFTDEEKKKQGARNKVNNAAAILESK